MFLSQTFLVLPLVLLLSQAAALCSEAQKLPLRPARVVGEFFGAIGGGVLVGFVPAIIFYRVYPDRTFDGQELFAFGVCALYLPVGYSLGNALGVYLVGRRRNETGSFLAAIASSLLVGAATSVLFLKLEKFSLIPILIPIGLIAAPAVATITFNLTRRYKKSDAGNSGSDNTIVLGKMRF